MSCKVRTTSPACHTTANCHPKFLHCCHALRKVSPIAQAQVQSLGIYAKLGLTQHAEPCNFIVWDLYSIINAKSSVCEGCDLFLYRRGASCQGGSHVLIDVSAIKLRSHAHISARHREHFNSSPGTQVWHLTATKVVRGGSTSYPWCAWLTWGPFLRAQGAVETNQCWYRAYGYARASSRVVNHLCRVVRLKHAACRHAVCFVSAS